MDRGGGRAGIIAQENSRRGRGECHCGIFLCAWVDAAGIPRRERGSCRIAGSVIFGGHKL